MAAVKHSSPRLIYGQNAYLSFSFTPHTVFCFWGMECRKREDVYKRQGAEERKEMLFWTREEYTRFSEAMMDKPLSFYAFEVLYWCGVREGELLDTIQMITTIMNGMQEEFAYDR